MTDREMFPSVGIAVWMNYPCYPVNSGVRSDSAVRGNCALSAECWTCSLLYSILSQVWLEIMFLVKSIYHLIAWL